MDRVLEKFNIFDVISMLIPGMTFILCIRLSMFGYNTDIYNIFDKYTIIAVLVWGYILGLVFIEIGSRIDAIIHKIYYKGNIKETFLLEFNKNKVFDSEIYYEMGQAVKKHIIYTSKLDNLCSIDQTINCNKQINRYIFNYLVDFLEFKKLKNKSDRMQALTEMSRSLMIAIFVCFLICLCNLFFCVFLKSYTLQNFIYSFIFLVLFVLFTLLKTRYEKYRIRTMVRTYYMTMINNLAEFDKA